MSETLDFPTIEEAAPASTAVAAAAPVALDLSQFNLTDVALAQFGKWRDKTAAARKTLAGVQHDLSTQAKIDDAKSLRHRLINVPLADARKVSKGLKSKLTAVSAEVGEELTRIEADYGEVAKLITPQIEAREQQLAEEKAERERVAAERAAGFRAKIAAITACVARSQGISAERIGNGIAAVEAIVTDAATWEEFQPEAEAAKTETLAAMRALHASTLAAEQAAAALEAQRLETERVAAETKAAAEKLAADMAEFERKQAEFQAQQAAAAKLVAEQQAAADAAKGKESQGAKAAEPPETLAQKVLRLGNQMSYFEAAEGDSYRKESGARELCRAEFNAAVKQAIAEGVKVNLRGCLVPTEIINQLQPHADLVAAPAVVTPLADSGNGDTPAPSEREAPPDTPVQDIQPVLKVEAAMPDTTDRDEPASTSPSVGSTGAGQATDVAPSVAVRTTGYINHFAPPAAERPTLKLGEIQNRLGFDVSSDFLASLGFIHTQEKASKLYLESKFKDICAGISAHVLAVAHEHSGKAALAA